MGGGCRSVGKGRGRKGGCRGVRLGVWGREKCEKGVGEGEGGRKGRKGRRVEGVCAVGVERRKLEGKR